MNDVALRVVAAANVRQAMSRGSALFIAVLVVVALSALAFWPTPAWSPPHRPLLKAPIVFDEFVNPPNPGLASSSAPDPAAR